MKKMTKQEVRNRKIEEIIRITWGSLESHLPHTYGSRMVRGETYKFHQDTVKEYVRIIQLVTELYDDEPVEKLPLNGGEDYTSPR